MELSKKLKIFLNYFVGPALFVWLSFSIWHQIKHQSDVQVSWQLIRTAFTGNGFWKMMLVLLLMMINWGIEACKWQMVVKPIEQISFWNAYRSIFAGQAFAVNTINRAGDFVGRVLYLHEGNRLRAVALSIVSSMSQLLVTFLIGYIAWIGLRFSLLDQSPEFRQIPRFWLNAVTLGLLIGICLLTLLYFNVAFFIERIEKIPFIARFRFFIEKLEALHGKELTGILGLSIIRYMVFIVQYVILLQVFGVDASVVNLCMLVAVMFMVLAIVPSITLAELGFRGKVSLQLFGMVSSNHLGIIAAAAGIWIINLIIPAILGSVMMLGIRLFSNKNGKRFQKY